MIVKNVQQGYWNILKTRQIKGFSGPSPICGWGAEDLSAQFANPDKLEVITSFVLRSNKGQVWTPSV